MRREFTQLIDVIVRLLIMKARGSSEVINIAEPNIHKNKKSVY